MVKYGKYFKRQIFLVVQFRSLDFLRIPDTIRQPLPSTRRPLDHLFHLKTK